MLRGTRACSGCLALLAVALFVRPFASASAQSVQGTLRILELESRVFGNKRNLRVWLPPGYHEPANRDRIYPVLYLNDGQNLFDSASTVLGSQEWRVDETLTSLLGEGRIPPLIVVGVDNAGRSGRTKEYLPYPDEFLDPPEPAPQGALYGEFLADDVLPLIESRFRVAADPQGRALGGSSYGALVALHVAISRPELFSRLLLESPSLYVDDERVLREAAEASFVLKSVYLGVGTNELALPGCPEDPGNAEAVEGVESLARILRANGLRDGEDLFTFVEPCAEHNEAAWARRLPTAVGFLYRQDPPRPAR